MSVVVKDVDGDSFLEGWMIDSQRPSEVKPCIQMYNSVFET